MSPVNEFARRSLTVNILADEGRSCLDSPSRKRLTYQNARIVLERREITLASRIESVDEAAMAADDFAKSRGLDADFVSAIDLAIRESVANAVKHGNKFDDTKSVEVTLADDPEGFEIVVRDFGTGFAVDDIPDPTNPENLLKANGRGILFMRSFMDEVEWSHPEDGGLSVKMRKVKK